MPRTWTPEQRESFGKKMQERRAAKVDKPEAPTNGNGVHEFSPSALISELNHLPLDSLTFDDCGLLLNAFSVASTSVGKTRRERQEQMDAGTLRTPCNTCKRMIDISKSGGFQVLTERDEHHQPVNRYYCSQNCLLARNMPSHRTKKLPGDVGANVQP